MSVAGYARGQLHEFVVTHVKLFQLGQPVHAAGQLSEAVVVDAEMPQRSVQPFDGVWQLLEAVVADVERLQPL